MSYSLVLRISFVWLMSNYLPVLKISVSKLANDPLSSMLLKLIASCSVAVLFLNHFMILCNMQYSQLVFIVPKVRWSTLNIRGHSLGNHKCSPRPELHIARYLKNSKTTFLSFFKKSKTKC